MNLAEFEKYGFNVEDTGGGCQWLRKPIGNGLSLCITDGEAGLPDLTAQLFLMSDSNGDPVAQTELMTTHQMFDHIAHSIDRE